MTYREVFIAYTSIVKRRKQEMTFIASCLGAKIDDNKEERDDHQKLTPEQEELMQKALAESMAKKGLKKWPTSP